MANQYSTGQGQGMGPTSIDPNDRTLASGINAGQGLPNLDPNKTQNPYASAAQSIGQNVANPPPAAPTNPYGSTPAPAPARQQAPQPAAGPPPVPSQAMGQPPNPYIGRLRAAGGGQPTPAQSVAANVVQPPAPTQMGAANVAAGLPANATPTPSANGQWAPTLTSNYTAPGQNYTTFDPNSYNAYGSLLASEASGNLTPAQVLANKQNFASDYYDQGMDAANKSAGAGLTGDSGVSRQMQQTIAGSIAKAQTNANAALQQHAQDQLGALETNNLNNEQFAQGLDLSQEELQQNAQNAFNSTQATLAGQQNQANIAKNQINAQANQPWYTTLAQIVGGVANKQLQLNPVAK